MPGARHAKIVEIAQSMATLTHDVYADYAPLLDACDDKTLMGEQPILEVFDDPAALDRERPHLELRESLGFRSERLNANDIGELEPALSGKFSHGLLFPDWRAVSDTMGFVAALTESFVAQGGIRIRTEASRIEEDRGLATGVTLANGERVQARHVVVAAGIGARRFFGALGVSVPLAGIAGYQAVVADPGVEMRHSTIYADGGFCFTPMSRGLQIGGTIEFAGAGAEPNFRRAEIILAKAKRVLPEMKTSQVEYGVGYRPFLPDTKPVIDRSRRLGNVFMAFGHGQLGLTLGATTGRLIADLVAQRPTKQNLAPFSAYRFS